MKVVILAGGLGSRLSEETQLRPKPMVEIGGMPILWHIMKSFSADGFDEFIICLGYKGYMIKEFFANYALHTSDLTIDFESGRTTTHCSRAERWRVTLVDTGLDTMTGGRLRQIQPYLGQEPFFLTYGDGLADINLRELAAFHSRHGKRATVTAARAPARFGALQLEDSTVKNFLEKPTGEGGWINGGFFVLNPSVLSLIGGNETVWEQEPMERLAHSGELAAYQHHGFWQPMDTLREKNHLEALWSSGRAPWHRWSEAPAPAVPPTAESPVMRGSQVKVDAEFWRGKRVLVTGHTGFKGSWLCHWLVKMGAEVSGFALDPVGPHNMFEATSLADFMDDHRGDVRNLDRVTTVIRDQRPEIVFHLAAQPLVRKSYTEPIDTFATNVMGTANVLEAARASETVRAIVVVTSDKCYENRETGQRYRESDSLGGHDPYSASKACTELVAAAYRTSFFQTTSVALATARAGNVIGGGDWAADRLIPDCLRAFASGDPVVLRYPSAIRPWQHVLEPLGGYLQLAQLLWDMPAACAPAYNFGPGGDARCSVLEVVQLAAEAWGDRARWECAATQETPHEAANLDLDSSLAARDLGWHPHWDLRLAVEATMEWYCAHRANGAIPGFMQALTWSQIDAYLQPDSELGTSSRELELLSRELARQHSPAASINQIVPNQAKPGAVPAGRD